MRFTEYFTKANPLIFFSVYLLLHFLIRVSLSDTFQLDDREQVIHSQILSLGYMMPQPPLYGWLSWLFFKIFGVGIFSLTLLKYSLIYLTFFFIHRLTQKLFVNQVLQKICFYSFLLMPSFFWHMHQGFTHTILLGLSIILSVYVFNELRRSQTGLNYFFFGVVIALGFYSKYSYLIFFPLLIISALFVKEFRKVILDKKISITLITVLILISPHLFWLLTNIEAINEMASKRLMINKTELNYLENTLNISSGLIGFIFPLIIPFIFLSKRLKNFNQKFSENSFFKLFTVFYIILLANILILSALHNFPMVKVRWLHPIMMMFPFWFISFIDTKEDITAVFYKRFMIFVLFLITIVLGVRFVQNSYGPELGYVSRVNTPVIETLKKLPNKMLRCYDTIITDDYDIYTHSLTIFEDKNLYIDAPGVPFRPEIKNEDKFLFLSVSNDTQNFVSTKIGSDTYRIYYSETSKNTCL